MKETLEKYFIEFGQLDLPKIGSLRWQRKDAYVDGGIWIEPKESIVFETIDIPPSKQFYNFISDALDISSEQASIQFEKYVSDIISLNNESFELGSLGVFNFKDNQIEWFSYLDSNQYYRSIQLDTIANDSNSIYQTTSGTMQWWIWALIMSVVAIIAILIKNYQ